MRTGRTISTALLSFSFYLLSSQIPQGFNYSEITPVLIKGIQDQQISIESIREENQELRKSNELLLKQIQSLENRLKQIESVLPQIGMK